MIKNYLFGVPDLPVLGVPTEHRSWSVDGVLDVFLALEVCLHPGQCFDAFIKRLERAVLVEEVGLDVENHVEILPEMEVGVRKGFDEEVLVADRLPVQGEVVGQEVVEEVGLGRFILKGSDLLTRAFFLWLISS